MKKPSAAPKQYRDTLIDQMISDPNYIIRRDGTILSKASQRAPLIEVGKKYAKRGSKSVSYGFGNVNLSVPRILYRKFVGALDHKKYVVFKNGDKSDLRPENLEQVTMEEHLCRIRGLERKIDDRDRRLAQLRMAKLTPEIVAIIRSLHEAGMGKLELAVLVGVHKQTIWSIVKGKTWKHMNKEATDGKEES